LPDVERGAVILYYQQLWKRLQEELMHVLRRRVFLTAAVGAAAVVLLPVLCHAQAGPPPSGRRIALSGYDPVAYFADGRPEKGSEAFWFPFDDVVYLFRSAEHRSMFASAPEHYAPQYEGFCAASVSKGSKVEPDPEAWVIVNGKLFVLRLKERIPDFKRDAAALIDKADANWRVLRHQPGQRP